MTVDFIAVLSGVIQLVISLTIGILFLFISYWFFKKLTVNIDDLKELKKNNIALAIFMGAIIFSVAWITKYSVKAGMDGIAIIIRNPKSNFISGYLITSGFLILQIIISGLIAFSSIWLAVQVFMKLTRDIDEMNEIKKNNIAISIILAVIIISISLFIEPAIVQIMNGLIPYPTIDVLPKVQ